MEWWREKEFMCRSYTMGKKKKMGHCLCVSVEDVLTYFHLENQQNVIWPGVPKLLHMTVSMYEHSLTLEPCLFWEGTESGHTLFGSFEQYDLKEMVWQNTHFSHLHVFLIRNRSHEGSLQHPQPCVTCVYVKAIQHTTYGLKRLPTEFSYTVNI